MANDDLRISSATVASALGASARIPGIKGIVNNAFLGSAFVKVGEWTPTISFNGGTTGITYDTTQRGHYFLIAQEWCLFDWEFILTNKGSDTGTLRLDLPFTAYSGANLGGAFTTYLTAGVGITTVPVGRAISNQAYMQFVDQSGGSISAALDDGHISNTTNWRGVGSYRTNLGGLG